MHITGMPIDEREDNQAKQWISQIIKGGIYDFECQDENSEYYVECGGERCAESA